jgi:hypothetical protein
MFSHEKFQAYQLSVEYWEEALKLIKNIPSGNSIMKDQLRGINLKHTSSEGKSQTSV